MNRYLLSFAAFVFVCFSMQTALAATFTVTKIGDTSDGACDADCSFREAVTAANNAASDDIITFDGTVFGSAQTIVLSLGEIIINANGSLTINGTGSNLLTIDGNNASRILTVNLATATINGMTFTRGNGVSSINTGRAGAVYNAGGTAVINNSVITNNSAVNGGGLNNASSSGNDAHLTLNNCIVSNNTATTSSGGGMQNFSTSTIIINNSLFVGNTSGGTTGGGGAQFNGIVRVTNSTFANNSAPSGSGGGIQSNGSNQILTNVTISGNSSANNGGGLHRGSTNVNFFIRNSIIAGNNGVSTSPDVTNSTGGLDSEGNNIIGNVGTSTGWEMSDLLNTNPMLGTLADNGGPTMTFLPMAGSPAIDGGQNCVLDLTCATNNPPQAVTTDQRGVMRPSGTAVDIGSVEVASMATIASVSGRVLSPEGRTAGRTMVTISDTNGVVQTDMTNQFGHFTFSGIATGQTYTLTVSSKRYNFTPQMLTVNGDVNNVMITATSQNIK